MTVPYSVVVINERSVRRGYAPEVLQALLRELPITLRMFRAWTICLTTHRALAQEMVLPQDARIDAIGPSWICLFTHMDRETDPTGLIEFLCGPGDPALWTKEHLRHRFGPARYSHTGSPLDDILRVSKAGRVDLEAGLLFDNFNPHLV